MEEVIAHGAEVVLMKQRLRRSLSGLDEGTMVYCVPHEGYFAIGGVSPEYPYLRIHDVEEEYDAGDVICTLTVRGIKSGSRREIGRKWKKSIEGWDECVVQMVASDNATFDLGDTLTGSGAMYMVEKGEDHLQDNRWCLWELLYRGIKDAKFTQRVISVNEDIVSPGEPIFVDLPGGWPDARLSEVSFPKIVVTDTLTTETAPDTAAIPGNATPPSPPAIQSITITGDGLRYTWPNQWKIASVNSVPLFLGAAPNILTVSYEFVWPTKFA